MGSVHARGALAYAQLRGAPLEKWQTLDPKRQHLIIPCADTLRANQRPAALSDLEVSWDIICAMMVLLKRNLDKVFHVPTEHGGVIYLQASADGRMLNEDLQADQITDFVGFARDSTCELPLDVETRFFRMSAEERAAISEKVIANLANNVDTYVLQDMSGFMWWPVANFMCKKGGHKGVLARLGVVRSAVSVCLPRLQAYVQELQKALVSGDRSTQSALKQLLDNPPIGDVKHCVQCVTHQTVCEACNSEGYTHWDPDHRKCIHCHTTEERCGLRGRVRFLEQDQLCENQKAGSMLHDHTAGETDPLYGMMHWLKKMRNWLYKYELWDEERQSWLSKSMLQAAWTALSSVQQMLDHLDVQGRHKLKDKHAVAVFRKTLHDKLLQVQSTDGGLVTMKVPNKYNNFEAHNHASFGRPTGLVWLNPEGGGFIADGALHVVWSFKQTAVWELAVVLGSRGNAATTRPQCAHPQDSATIRLRCPAGMCRMGRHLLICDEYGLHCYHYVAGQPASPSDQKVSCVLKDASPSVVRVLDTNRHWVVVASTRQNHWLRGYQLIQAETQPGQYAYYTGSAVLWTCDPQWLTPPLKAMCATSGLGGQGLEWKLYVILSGKSGHVGSKLVSIDLSLPRSSRSGSAMSLTATQHLVESGLQEFGGPSDICMMGSTTLLFADVKQHRVKMVNLSNPASDSGQTAISTFTGTGRTSVEGGPKLSQACLHQPYCLAVMGSSVLVGLASGVHQGSVVQVDNLHALCLFLSNGRAAMESNGVVDKWHPDRDVQRDLVDRMQNCTLYTMTRGLDETVQYLEKFVAARRLSLGLDGTAGTDGSDYCIPSHTVEGFRDNVVSLSRLVVHCEQAQLERQVLKIVTKHLMSERELEGFYGCLTLMFGAGNHAFTASDFRRMVRTMVHELAKDCADSGHVVVWGAAKSAKGETYSLTEGQRDTRIPLHKVTQHMFMSKVQRNSKRTQNRRLLKNEGPSAVIEGAAAAWQKFKQRCVFVRAVCAREGKLLANDRYKRHVGEKKKAPRGAPDRQHNAQINYQMLATMRGRTDNNIPVMPPDRPGLEKDDVVPVRRSADDTEHAEYDYYLRLIAERHSYDEHTAPAHEQFKFWWLELVPIDWVQERLEVDTLVWQKWRRPNSAHCRNYQTAPLEEVPTIEVPASDGGSINVFDVLVMDRRTVNVLMEGGQSEKRDVWLLTREAHERLKRTYPVGSDSGNPTNAQGQANDNGLREVLDGEEEQSEEEEDDEESEEASQTNSDSEME